MTESAKWRRFSEKHGSDVFTGDRVMAQANKARARVSSFKVPVLLLTISN